MRNIFLSTLLLFSSLVFADAVIFSGSDVKALKSNLSLNGVTKILSTNGNPSTGGGLDAPPGSLALSANTGVVYIKTGAGITAWEPALTGLINLATGVTGILPIANGGTGSASKNFVDLTTGQTIGGTKTFSSTIVGDISGNAATVTTNANLTGAVTSTGNATSLGSFTSANLSTALTNETGSGAAVFATSPTLVTPNIGAATATSVAASGTVTGSNLSGTNTGDQTITLTGDVTGSGTGSFATAIGASKVTNSMLAGSIDLTSKVTGALPVANGGTGQTSKVAAFDSLSPMTTSGDIIYGGASGTGTRLAKGTDGNVLTLVSGVPAWSVAPIPTTDYILLTANATATGSTNTGVMYIPSLSATSNGVITVGGSSTLGTTFTAAVDCELNMSVIVGNSAVSNLTLTKNSSGLTAGAFTPSSAMANVTNPAGYDVNMSVNLKLVAGDVIRIQTQSASNNFIHNLSLIARRTP
jgi:hypothetical protein